MGVMLFDKAANDPDGLALDDLTRRRSWREVEDRTARIARLLREDLGLRADDHAALLMENRVECVELIHGALLAGIWLTPINSHLQEEEIAYIVEDSGARVLFADAAHEALARRSKAPTVLLAGNDLDRALAGASDEPMPRDGPAGGPMVYTSGTTGQPKGVKRARAASLGAAIERVRGYGTLLGLDGSGPHLVTGPLYHAAPGLFAVYDQVCGAPVVIMPRWDAAETLGLITERQIRHAHLVPTMFVRLLRLDEAVRGRFDPSPLSMVLHGAAPISREVKNRMIDWWGKVLVEYWGASECGVVTLADSDEWLAHPGTVGRALATYEIFATSDTGERLPHGEVGALYCRHKHVPRLFEYHRAPEKTAESYLEPGVFTIGDIGSVDADGWVYLADRKSNMIISGGVNIYAAEVESALQRHPAIADVAVFGIPDDDWGESVKAAVQLADGFHPSAELESNIIAFARQHLATYKASRSIDFEESLPRFPTGKLHTRVLRERYWAGREKSI